MLQQISADPLSVEKATKHQEKRYRKAANLKRHSMATLVVPPEVGTKVKEEVKEEPESSCSDSDYIPPASGEGTKDTSSDPSSSSSSSSGDEAPSLAAQKKPH